MILFRETRKRARQIVWPVLCTAVIGYFVYHTVQGEKGLYAYLSLSQEAQHARATLATVRAKREALEQRVILLRPDSLDLDMLEERARTVLGLVREDEVMIFDHRVR